MTSKQLLRRGLILQHNSHHILTSLVGDYVGQTRHLHLHHGEEDGDVMGWVSWGCVFVPGLVS